MESDLHASQSMLHCLVTGKQTLPLLCNEPGFHQVDPDLRDLSPTLTSKPPPAPHGCPPQAFQLSWLSEDSFGN